MTKRLPKTSVSSSSKFVVVVLSTVMMSLRFRIAGSFSTLAFPSKQRSRSSWYFRDNVEPSSRTSSVAPPTGRINPYAKRLYSSPPPSDLPPKMANLYQEWTLQEDELLWNNRQKSSAELASLLGRGIRGVQARLSKLQDVESPAYERLFVTNHKQLLKKTAHDDDINDETQSTMEPNKKKNKLVPVSEVLRRIEWDYNLDPSDFYVLHYDRLQDAIVKSKLDAPNESISNDATSLIKALPEHRIQAILYKERLVWDRSTKLDLVFSDNGGIAGIVATYPEWKAEQDRIAEYNRERQDYISLRMTRMLGMDLYGRLEKHLRDLKSAYDDPTKSTKQHVEMFLQQALDLFRTLRQTGDAKQFSMDPSIIPKNDWLALEELSELVACCISDMELRQMTLCEISIAMESSDEKSSQSTNARHQPVIQSIAMLEDDLEESFVRGSGPGGQKINKTSNRVILIHRPTQLRVECQDTRSLQQNRKIARKRLKEKLDEHLNGSLSKLQQKHQKASQKRQRSKTKNRARHRKKQEEKRQKMLAEEAEVAPPLYE